MSRLRQTLASIAVGGLIGAGLMAIPAARADGTLSATEKAYADAYHQPICDTIRDYPTVGGVIGTWQGVQEDSELTVDNAGDVIDYAVGTYCPQYTGLLKQTADAIENAQHGRQV